MVVAVAIFKIELSKSHKKKVSMTRKWHDHTLKTNTRHREEETQNTNCQMTLKGNLSKATSSLSFPARWLQNYKLSSAQQNKDQPYPHNTMEATINNELTIIETPP